MGQRRNQENGLVKIADMVCGKDVPQLGQLLLKAGYIIPQDLEFALEHQQYTQQPLGDILIRIGAVEREDLENVLRMQDAGKNR